MEDFEKKYNEALQRAKIALETDLHESGHWAVKYIFPELKESQDKKICKALISVLKSDFEKDNTINGISVAEIIDWLKGKNNDSDGSRVPYTAEIQTGDGGVVTVVNGEVTMAMPKFKIGDWVVFGNNLNGNSIYHIEKIENYHYTLRHILGGSLPLPFGNESDIRPWTLNDAKDGDILVDMFSSDRVLILFKGIFEGWILAHCGWNSYELSVREESFGYGNVDYTKYVPATKEQRDLLFQKMKEAGYEWDAKNKDLKKIELTQSEVTKTSDKGCSDGDKSKPKFKAGDWITDGNMTIQIEAVRNNCYLYCGDCVLYSTKVADKVYHLWTIQDAKDGDILVASDGSIFIFKEVCGTGCKHYVAFAKDDTIQVNYNLEHFWESSRGVHPATKEQRDLLFAKMEEAGYEWNDDKRELEKIEQKSDARNEEDNMWIEYFNRLLSYAYIKNSLALHNGTGEFRDFGNSPIGAKKWLDSLKDRFRNSN